MKRILCAVILVLTASSAPAANVGVSVSIGQPGFYGTLDVGNFSRPEVIYADPIIVQRTRYNYEPLYLRVPPSQVKRWRHYCGSYNACGRQVYFVRDDWYNNVYAPAYRERHNRDNGNWRHGNRNGRDWDRGNNRGANHGHGNDHDHDSGRGSGRGNY